MKMTESYTDCRSEVGITVGLVDSVITTMRVLVTRDLTDPEVQQALQDLRDDEDFAFFLSAVDAS